MNVSKHINKTKIVWMRLPILRAIFLGHARVLSVNAFSFSTKIVLLETDYKENMNILLLLTGSFLAKPLKTTAHGLPKISWTFLLQQRNVLTKSTKKVPFFKHSY